MNRRTDLAGTPRVVQRRVGVVGALAPYALVILLALSSWGALLLLEN